MNYQPATKQIYGLADLRRVSALVFAGCLIAVAISAGAQTTNVPDFASFQIISQRNIFNQSRVPHTRATHVTVPVVDSFAFVGTMSYAKGEFAFFNGSSSEFRKVLQVDGEIANFKVTDITPKSVTLTNGTNQVVLDLQTQMRRDDNGHWAMSSERASYPGAGSSYRSSSRSQFSSTSRPYASSSRSADPAMAGPGPDNMQINDTNLSGAEERPTPGEEENPPEASTPPGGGGNDALSRLMQRRAQEEQQLGR